MAEDTLKLEVKKLIVEELKLNREPESINDADSLFGGGLGLDSVDILTLVTAIEEKFDLSIEDDEVQKLNSVDDIASFVESKKA